MAFRWWIFSVPLISRIAALTGTVPLSQPGRLHLLDETYFRRIEAVDFAIRFDDGKNPDGITQADVVLTGVSRTSKTPNCMYLAHHYGMKAANVPIVSGVDPPLALFQINPRKIVGLHIDPYLLQEIRTTRAHVLGMPSSTDYADPDRIRQEVRQAKKLFRELKCHVIDVSSKAIEETSAKFICTCVNRSKTKNHTERNTGESEHDEHHRNPNQVKTST